MEALIPKFEGLRDVLALQRRILRDVLIVKELGMRIEVLHAGPGVASLLATVATNGEIVVPTANDIESATVALAIFTRLRAL